MDPRTLRRVPPANPAVLWVFSCIAGAALAQGEPAPPAGQEPGARVAWKYAPTGASFDGVVAADGVVFALDRSGSIHAIDAASGDVEWVRADDYGFGRGFGLALPARADSQALLLGCDAGLFALDRRTGRKLWHTAIAAGAAGPACTADMVIAGSSDGAVYACDLASGTLLWKHDCLADRPDDPPGFDGDQARFGGFPARPCDAATDGKMVVLTFFDQCRAVAIDAAKGERLWDFRTRGWTYGRPAIGPRNVYIVSQDRHVHAVDKEMGKEMWAIETRARNEAPAAPTERFVYFGSCDGHLYSADQVVGRIAWKFAIEGAEDGGAPIYASPLVSGDEVFLATLPGVVYGLDRHTGALLWKLRPSAGSELNSDLVADGRRLFLTTRKNDGAGESAVFAIDRP